MKMGTDLNLSGGVLMEGDVDGDGVVMMILMMTRMMMIMVMVDQKWVLMEDVQCNFF